MIETLLICNHPKAMPPLVPGDSLILDTNGWILKRIMSSGKVRPVQLRTYLVFQKFPKKGSEAILYMDITMIEFYLWDTIKKKYRMLNNHVKEVLKNVRCDISILRRR